MKPSKRRRGPDENLEEETAIKIERDEEVERRVKERRQTLERSVKTFLSTARSVVPRADDAEDVCELLDQHAELQRKQRRARRHRAPQGPSQQRERSQAARARIVSERLGRERRRMGREDVAESIDGLEQYAVYLRSLLQHRRLLEHFSRQR